MRDSSKKTFDRKLERIMELLDHEFYVVYLDKSVKCTCLHQGTGQPEPTCKRCLGTGFKIKIRIVQGVSQESSIPSTMRNTTGFVISRNYYLKSKDRMNNDDLIVDGNGIWFVFQAPDYASFDGEYIYQKCSAMPKKLDPAVFFKNFNQIVGR